MRNRTYGGVRGRKMTVGGKQPTSFSSYSIMTYIWNIYEPSDIGQYDETDPFDVFIYSLRREEAPQLNSSLYVEGRRCRIIAITRDSKMDEVCGFGDETYYKVCVI